MRRNAILLAALTLFAALALFAGGGERVVWAQAADLPATQQAAARLLETTVTVRIAPVAEGAGAAAAREVTVCSGASLGQGLIVTFGGSATGSRFRITLPDGGQAEGVVRVNDAYSGLTLLEIPQANLPALAPAEALPAIGGLVLTAAASGIEKPLVSRGILGGVDRAAPGTNLPPLLQCDVRTSESSGGAPIVDLEGRLVGIIAATATAGEKAGWTYAVPVSHVQRLLRARMPDQVVILKERRPVLGLTLGAGQEEGTVRVERVQEGSPAAQAGIRPDALVTAVDDVKVRSVYQVQFLLLKKQPGDAVKLAVQEGAAARQVEVTLGGGFVAPAGSVRVGPSILARRGEERRITVQNLGAGDADEGRSADGGRSAGKDQRISELESQLGASQASLAVLQKQIDAFALVIRNMQGQLERRDEERRRTEALMQALTDELARLRKQLDNTER